MNRRTFLQHTAAASAVALAPGRLPAAEPAPHRPTRSVDASRAHIGQPAVLLRGDFADPSVLRDGDDFYLTHSNTDPYGPAFLIWHSRDLYHWKPLCRALRQPLFTWAPELVKHQDRYYLYYPQVEKNYVITAPKITGPWSDPIDLNQNGIDPGHVVGPDGKRYLHLSGGTVVTLADDGLSVVGRRQKIYTGWPIPAEWNIESFALESPKLCFHRGYYYLTSAQGGTAGPSTSHMVVSARSRSPIGPWENSPYNPIVRTFSSRERWHSRGHGTLIEGPDGCWYLIYHAYEKGHRELGRCCLLEPVVWTDDGWFRSPHADDRERFLPRVVPNYVVRSDDFASSQLNLQWSFCGITSDADYQVGDGALRLTGASDTLRAVQVRCAEPDFEASVALEASDPSVEFGFIILYQPDKPIPAGLTFTRGKILKILRGKNWGPQIEAKGRLHFKLRVEDGDVMAFHGDGKTWARYPHGMEISGFTTSAFGGMGAWKIAAYIKGAGELRIRGFQYQSLAS